MSEGIGGLLRRSWSSLVDPVVSRIGNQSDYSTSWVVSAIAAIIGIFLIIMIIITVYQMYKSRPAKILLGPLDLFNPKDVILLDRDGTSAMTGSYTLAFYVKIDSVPDMRAASTPLLTWAGIWNLGYYAAEEQMIWTFGQTTSGQAELRPDIVSLPSVPPQRWTQIVMTFEGRTVDLYVNGKLVKAATLMNLPASKRSSLTIASGNILGKLAYLQMWPRRLTVGEVAGNYTDTSDSQGRPYIGPEFLQILNSLSIPNLFCPSGGCTGTPVFAAKSQVWEFPYA